VRRGGDAFGGGVRRGTGTGEGGGSLLPRRQRLLPAALQLEHGRQAAVRLPEAEQVAFAPPSLGGFAPRPDGLRVVAGELGAAAEAFQHVEAGVLVVPFRPQLERPAEGPDPVAVRVHGTGRRRRRQQRLPRPIGLATSHPMLGDHRGGRPLGLQPLCDRPVQGRTPRPGDLAIEGVADQGVPERHASGLGLGHDAAAEQLVRPFPQLRDVRHQLGIERLPDRGRRHDRAASVVRQPGRAEQDRVPHAVREREVLAFQQLQAGRARLESPTRGQRRPELLDEEGDAVGPVEHGAAQRRGCCSQGPLEQGGGGLGVERLDRDLPEVPCPA
jgi:hypothetical protein